MVTHCKGGTAHPVVFSLSSGMSSLKSFQGICVMMPAPSPESASAEQAPRCSMHPREVRACKVQYSYLQQCFILCCPQVEIITGGMHAAMSGLWAHLFHNDVGPLIPQVCDEAHLHMPGSISACILSLASLVFGGRHTDTLRTAACHAMHWPHPTFALLLQNVLQIDGLALERCG